MGIKDYTEICRILSTGGITLVNENVLSHIFDIIRIVDPMNSKVVKLKQDDKYDLGECCFNIWGKNKSCPNCISIISYAKDKTMVKLKYTEDKIFLVMGTPIKLKGRKVVLELAKDITDSIIYSQKEEEDEFINALRIFNNMLVKDELTEVYNRRYIKERLPIEILNSKIRNEPLSVIILDIDNFKAINDNYGHLVGDAVLNKFAQTIKKEVRGYGDWVARYGGDEFLIILPKTDNKSGVQIAERIRKRISEKEFIYNDIKISLSASFGICTVAGKKLSVEELIKCVDEKLYKAKNCGKNCIIN